jgi:hypothetical protein
MNPSHRYVNLPLNLFIPISNSYMNILNVNDKDDNVFWDYVHSYIELHMYLYSNIKK